MDIKLQSKLRLLKLDVLSFLLTLSSTESIALDLKNISASTSTDEDNLRGIISTVRRMDLGIEPLIIPAGRDNEGRLRWQINQTVVSKKELAKFLEEEILGKEGLKIKK